MEVHHHSHTPRKKWTHYFWEFLMLFLAVFCGFLAEYQLEHTIENKREKQYITSFLKDIKTDTSIIGFAINLRARRVVLCDSLIMLLKSPEREKHAGIIYWIGLRLSSSNRFGYSDRTIQQLRNAGGMRLIRAKGASDSIISYDIGIRRMQLDEDQSLDILKEYRGAMGRIFDASVFLSMLDSAGNSFPTIEPQYQPSFLTADKESINNFCTQVFFYRRSNEVIRNSLGSLSAKAKRIIAYLENEYHLK